MDASENATAIHPLNTIFFASEKFGATSIASRMIKKMQTNGTSASAALSTDSAQDE